jgi:hypothetical protein
MTIIDELGQDSVVLYALLNNSELGFSAGRVHCFNGICDEVIRFPSFTKT